MQKTTLYILILALCVPLCFIADLLFGSVYIPLNEMIEGAFSQSENSSIASILFEIRLPRVITACITGIALPISGLLMQTFFRNPLAGPDVLGISTGASLGVAIFSLAGGVGSIAIISSIDTLSSWGFIIAAGVGSCLVMLSIAAITPKVRDTASLLIIGIMLSSVTSAIVSVLQYFSNPQQIHEFLLWTFGSFSGVHFQHIKYMLIILVPVLAYTFFMQKSLNALLIGENYARSMGVHITRLRIGIVLCASLLAGIVTAFTGPIGFIGMAVPHIARMMFKTSNHKILLVSSALLGANLVMICDLLSQLPGFETSLPINIVTAIFGAPIVIAVIFRSKKTRLQY